MVVDRLTAYEDTVDDSVGSGVDDMMLEVKVDVSKASEVVLDVETDDFNVVPIEVTSKIDTVLEV